MRYQCVFKLFEQSDRVSFVKFNKNGFYVFVWNSQYFISVENHETDYYLIKIYSTQAPVLIGSHLYNKNEFAINNYNGFCFTIKMLLLHYGF